MSSSSSDSDSSERVRNVSELLVKSRADQQDVDESYAYKRKLGDLIFDAAFEGGNLGFIEKIDEYTYDLMIRPDVANPRYRVWFNFLVSNQRLNQCVVFNIVNMSDGMALFHEGLTPVVRCSGRPNWMRLHEDQVFYYKSRNHGDRFVLSIAFRFDSFDSQHQFALFYPYTLSDLTHFIDRWTVELKRRRRSDPRMGTRLAATKEPRCKTPNERSTSRNSLRQVRARSSLSNYALDDEQDDVNLEVEITTGTVLSKPVYLLKIDKRNTRDGVGSSRSAVVVSCRPGGNLDSLASLVCQGLIDFVLGDSAVARAAREFIDFYIFPMVDPDSVVSGNSKSLILGQSNMTTKLAESNRRVYSNFYTIRRKVSEIYSKRQSRVILIQICVGLTIIGSRIRGNHYSDSLRMEKHLGFPRLLSKYADHFYLENCEFSAKQEDDSHNSNVLFGHVSEKQNVDSYKLDVSPFAAYKRSLVDNKYEEYDQLKYISIGKALVYSLTELLKPKDRSFPQCVAEHLDSFLPKSEDIDDLALNNKAL